MLRQIALCLCVVALTTFTCYGQRSVPEELTFQGKVTNGDGNAIDGTREVTFRLYEHPTDGDALTALWTETHPNVVFSGGVFSVSLGSLTALSALSFDIPYYISIEVETDGEMFPRFALTSAPYSLNPGPAGTEGPVGPAGSTGVQGIQGVTGNTGEQGIQGTIGNTGEQGIQGTAGIPGDSVPTGFSIFGPSTVSPTGYTYSQKTIVAQGSDQWTQSVDMISALYAFATSVVDGKIYLWGGRSSSGSISKYRFAFDPGTETWSSSFMGQIETAYGGAAVYDGKTYFFGGIGASSLTVKVYNHSGSIWETAGISPLLSHSLTATTVGDKIYVIGGYNGSHLNLTHIFDPVTEGWSIGAPMITPRKGHSACAIGDKIYIFGGETTGDVPTSAVEEYNTVLNSWTTKSPMPIARFYLTASLVNDTILLTGGEESEVLSTCTAYYPATDSYSARSPLLSRRREHGAVVIGTKMHIMGGVVGTFVSRSTFEYSSDDTKYYIHTKD